MNPDAYFADEPYEVCPGCPLLTFIIGDVEQTVPYSSFELGVYEPGLIVLTFSLGILRIEGINLHELWRHLQLQDVRVVFCKKNNDPEAISVSNIHWENREEEV